MKIATDLNQSQLLAKILPIESADMFYLAGKGEPQIINGRMLAIGSDDYDALGGPDVLAWSLSALLEALEGTVDGENGETYLLRICKEDGEYMIEYQERWRGDDFGTEWYEDLVDACVEMIKPLNKRKLL